MRTLCLVEVLERGLHQNTVCSHYFPNVCESVVELIFLCLRKVLHKLKQGFTPVDLMLLIILTESFPSSNTVLTPETKVA